MGSQDKIKPTIRQRKMAAELVKGTETLREAALNAGYALTTAEAQPTKDILDKLGFKKAIQELLGGEEWVELIKKGLLERIKSDKDYTFIKSAELWAKLVGAFAPEKHEIAAISNSDRSKHFKEITQLVKKSQEIDISPEEEPSN